VFGAASLAFRLLVEPVFGASVLAVSGYISFMTIQNHPQPRYFAVVAFFAFFVVAQGAGALLAKQRWLMRGRCWEPKHRIAALWMRWSGWAVIARRLSPLASTE